VNADMKRDILRKTILRLLTKGKMHYTDLEKKMCLSGYTFATTNTFKTQLQYLLKNGYVTRISRGVYQITSTGEKYLDLLAFQE
jgi:DNA-binding PadR family transcriptional regulator